MNSKKAKKLKKIVYKSDDYRKREYAIVKKTGQIYNIGQLQEIETAKGKTEMSKRRIYQYLKKVIRHVPVKKLEKFILYA